MFLFSESKTIHRITKRLMMIWHKVYIKSGSSVSERVKFDIILIRDKTPEIPTIIDKYFFDFIIMMGNKKYKVK